MADKALWGMPLPAEIGNTEDQALQAIDAQAVSQKPSKPLARVGRETKGRRGKGVTIVYDLKLKEVELEQLASHLKTKCGTGGTVKDGKIEIQGEMRDRVAAELEILGYAVKKSGG